MKKLLSNRIITYAFCSLIILSFLAWLGLIAVEGYDSEQINLFFLHTQDFLADFSQGFSGVYGSRMTGGGFGGCTVSLMPFDIVPEYTVAVKEAFLRRFKTDPPVYCITASDGAQIIKED